MNDLMTRRAAIARAACLLGGALSATTVAGVLAGCDRRALANAASALGGDRKELVAALADYIIPRTDTPGARDAGVQDFVDVMMSDYYPAEDRDRFVAGLDRLDARSERAFGSPFLQSTPDEQLRLVEAYNRQAFGAPASASEAPAGVGAGESATPDAGVDELDREWEPADVGRQAFFRTLKELVVVGYYTSEVGATQELRVNPMGSWIADLPYEEVGRAWA